MDSGTHIMRSKEVQSDVKPIHNTDTKRVSNHKSLIVGNGLGYVDKRTVRCTRDC